MSELLTPLNAWHKAHGAKMAPFAGWEMPIQYEGIIAEHMHTRSLASVFDICHMGQIIIKGEDARNILAKAVSHNLETLAIGKCRYGFLLTEEGTVIDDLIIYHKAENHFFLVVNAACLSHDLQIIKERVGNNLVEDISANSGKIDVQGPQSLAVMEEIFQQNLHDLKYFSFALIKYKGEEILVSRTGYTGELGYELYCPNHIVESLWNDLTAHKDVKPAGLGARDTLRLECGLSLYGHELDTEHTIAESALDSMLTSEAIYIGKEATKNINKELLIPLQLEGRRSARNGDSILESSGSSTIIGTVTSGSFAPSLGYAVAFAFVHKDHAHKDTFIIKSGKNELNAIKTTVPFYTKGTARTKLI